MEWWREKDLKLLVSTGSDPFFFRFVSGFFFFFGCFFCVCFLEKKVQCKSLKITSETASIKDLFNWDFRH